MIPNRRGISLLELSIALAVVASLSVVILGSSEAVMANADIQQRRESLQAIAQECRYYRAKFDRWPRFVHDLIDNDLINAGYFNRLVSKGFQLNFISQGQLLLISDGQGMLEVVMPSASFARLSYARNSETNKFKQASLLAY